MLAAGYVSVQFGVPWLREREWPSLAGATAVGVWMLLLLAAAEGLIARRSAARAAAARAEEEERRRAEAEQRRASDERLQIARELHDVLAHSLSVINVQSAVRPRAGRPPTRAGPPGADRDQDHEPRGAAEVQGILDALRRPQDQVPLTPTPSLADLASLARRAQDAGLTVVTRIDGTPVPLPARSSAVPGSCRRRSRTCCATPRAPGRAAGPVPPGRGARARDRRRPSPDGPAAAGRDVEEDGPSGGNGIPGMRERVLALGGTLEAAPHGAGFRVTGTFPLSASAEPVPADTPADLPADAAEVPR